MNIRCWRCTLPRKNSAFHGIEVGYESKVLTEYIISISINEYLSTPLAACAAIRRHVSYPDLKVIYLPDYDGSLSVLASIYGIEQS